MVHQIAYFTILYLFTWDYSGSLGLGMTWKSKTEHLRVPISMRLLLVEQLLSAAFTISIILVEYTPLLTSIPGPHASVLVGWDSRCIPPL
jgi:hypothetical protein